MQRNTIETSLNKALHKLASLWFIKQTYPSKSQNTIPKSSESPTPPSGDQPTYPWKNQRALQTACGPRTSHLSNPASWTSEDASKQDAGQQKCMPDATGSQRISASRNCKEASRPACQWSSMSETGRPTQILVERYQSAMGLSYWLVDLIGFNFRSGFWVQRTFESWTEGWWWLFHLEVGWCGGTWCLIPYYPVGDRWLESF